MFIDGINDALHHRCIPTGYATVLICNLELYGDKSWRDCISRCESASLIFFDASRNGVATSFQIALSH